MASDDSNEVKRMKQFFQRRVFRRKWVVPVAALVLTLSIGSIAFATSESTGAGSPVSATVSTPTTATASAATAAAAAGPVDGGTVGSTGSSLSSDQSEAQQAKENAILDLIREKMTSTDQATFDRLRAVAVEQQAALQQAQADLNDTKAKITTLIDKYLGVPTGASS
jgi:hypothetical protein